MLIEIIEQGQNIHQNYQRKMAKQKKKLNYFIYHILKFANFSHEKIINGK